MENIKLTSLAQILLDDNKFKELTSNNPWGFNLEIGKLGSFQVLPNPQFDEKFRKDGWSFKQLAKS